MITRRAIIGGAAASLMPAFAKTPKVRFGAMDGILRMSGKVEVVEAAAKLGFEGVEVNIGRPTSGASTLPLADAGLQARYLAAARQHKMAISGVVLDVLHVNWLKSDKLGEKWVADGIQITAKMKAGVLLLPFFGKGALQTQPERDYVADVLKNFVGQAQKSKVILGLEDTISAEDNARILDRIGSKWASVYYDIGNSTFGGFDAPKEIRWLGKNRICQIHLKDRGYLGEGKVDMPDVVRAMKEIGYAGWAVLETSSPSKNFEEDGKRNLAYARGLLEKEGLR